jgi:hypothetical protein
MNGDTASRRRAKGSRTQQLRRLAIAVVVGFALLWGLVLWQAHSSLISLHPSFGRGIGPQLVSRSKGLVSVSKPYEKDNPYFGWQPPIPSESSCSWRECFKNTHQCPVCRDLPEDLAHDAVPEDSSSIAKDWIPDVTMLHRMRLQGHDAQGNLWPPALPEELCEDIGGYGGKNDDNREREYTRLRTVYT